MKRELMDVLACPVCKGGLELSVTEELERDVINGSLSCLHCNAIYPIEGSIPRLLPPQENS